MTGHHHWILHLILTVMEYILRSQRQIILWLEFVRNSLLKEMRFTLEQGQKVMSRYVDREEAKIMITDRILLY